MIHPLESPRRFHESLSHQILFVMFAMVIAMPLAVQAADLDYTRDVKPLLTKYCVGCHSEKENPSEIYLDSLREIRRGGPDGPIVFAKNAVDSKLAKVLRGSEPQMPPSDSPQLTEAEIETICTWISLGMPGTDERQPLKAMLRVPSITPISKGPPAITSMGVAGEEQLLIGQYGAVYLASNQWRNTLPIDIVGKVTQIRTTPNGRFSVVVAGIPGVGGQAIVLENVRGSSVPKVVRMLEGHTDTLYSGVISPDGRTLATGGYDRHILIWDVASGQLVRKLDGHNGAIYDLDFDSTGKTLASASADETIKVWNVATGERLDTFGQCEAEQYAVRFDTSNQRIFAAGADRRVRVWKLLSMEKPSVSPMLHSVFAHEAPVTFIAFSKSGELLATTSDDKQIKLWNTADMSPLGAIGTVEDCPTGLVWNKDQQSLSVSTILGQLKQLDARSHKNPSVDPLRDSPTNPSLRQMSGPENELIALQETDAPHTMRDPQVLPGNCRISGTLKNEDMQRADAGDWYALSAKANETWMIQVDASRSGSPLDSTLDVLTEDGSPIQRTRLQAVRESYFTFRGKDSTNPDDFRMHRWEDMELNELLYAGGEVVKLWHYPRGPDSGFKTYPGFGNRFTYYDTTATTHALNEPAWIVRELADHSPTIPNGLPVFPIYYSNDDDANRRLGKDSSIAFTPKSDGKYLIRVRDARGQAGDQYTYHLSVAPPRPRFDFRVEQKEITLRPGVGTEFSVVVDRYDQCDGDIEVTLEGLPDSIQSPSLVIESNQHRAVGLLQSPPDLIDKIKDFKLTLRGRTRIGDRIIEGNESQEIAVKLSDKPTMHFKLIAKGKPADAAPLTELTIHPGETISATLVIERRELQGDIPFGFDDSGRNLPHGCYVDNIGLSGLLIPAGQTQREVFITASKVTRPQSRPFHLKSNTEGNPSSSPITLHVVE